MSAGQSSGSESVIVMGMHRSGTSATAGALAKLGWQLGARLVPAAPDNPGGYFEHADVVAINEALLDAMDRSWDDVRALPEGWGDVPAARAARHDIERILADLEAAGPWALKDPRLCRLLPLWRQAWVGRQPACLFVVRHPDEVAASLHARDGMPELQAHVLWLRHVLDAAAHSAGLRRGVLPYARLLADPRAALEAAFAQAEMQLPDDPPGAALDAFVQASARHHAQEGAVAKSDWHALALECHALLHEAREPWAGIHSISQRFDDLYAEQAPLLDALGAAARAADCKRRASTSRVLTREAELADALARAEALSHQHLQEAGALHRQLAMTTDALGTAETLSVQRMELAQALQARLDGTQAALAEVEALALRRLDEMHGLQQRVADTEAAFRNAEGLALRRLDEAHALQQRLAETEVAFSNAEGLALRRMSEVQDLQLQLEKAGAALAQAEEVALHRLEHSQQMQQALDRLRAEHATTSERLERIERSLPWQLWRALRRLLGRTGRPA